MDISGNCCSNSCLFRFCVVNFFPEVYIDQLQDVCKMNRKECPPFVVLKIVDVKSFGVVVEVTVYCNDGFEWTLLFLRYGQVA